MGVYRTPADDWLAARHALIQELTRLRDRYMFNMPDGLPAFAGALDERKHDDYGWRAR